MLKLRPISPLLLPQDLFNFLSPVPLILQLLHSCSKLITHIIVIWYLLQCLSLVELNNLHAFDLLLKLKIPLVRLGKFRLKLLYSVKVFFLIHPVSKLHKVHFHILDGCFMPLDHLVLEFQSRLVLVYLGGTDAHVFYSWLRVFLLKGEIEGLRELLKLIPELCVDFLQILDLMAKEG
jgi:hypothetical protein